MLDFFLSCVNLRIDKGKEVSMQLLFLPGFGLVFLGSIGARATKKGSLLNKSCLFSIILGMALIAFALDASDKRYL
ncbi:MAG: hypothetical protein WCZ69_03020 [Candidatus Paceibacterota bacterium]